MKYSNIIVKAHGLSQIRGSELDFSLKLLKLKC